MTPVEAFPLQWPAGRPRAKSRSRAKFHCRVDNGTWSDGSRRTTKGSLTIADSRDRVLRELANLGARGVVISSNLRLRQDGLPISSQAQPADPGIAVYFSVDKVQHCLCCDHWDRAADNLAAIAKHVEAMRGQLRWGVARAAEMFAGFKSLPAPLVTPARFASVDEAERWCRNHDTVTGYLNPTILQDAEVWKGCYRRLVKLFHPDAGGSAEDWSALQSAADLINKHHKI